MPEPRYANAPERICPQAESRAQQIADLFEAELRAQFPLPDDLEGDDDDSEFDPFGDQDDEDFSFVNDAIPDLRGTDDYD